VNDADLVRLVEELEDRAESYVTLEAVERVAGGEVVSSAMASGLLLVDFRSRTDGSGITLCRLNRHHPLVRQLTGW
jgi:hypothetical protein